MTRRPKPDQSKYLTVFAITTLVFFMGLLLGNYVSGIKLNNLEDLENDLRTDTMAVEMQFLLLAEDPCRSVNTTPLTDELQNIASRLDYMENKLGNDNSEVLRIKEYYSLLELRHWLLLKKTRAECGLNSDLILFFYSNKNDCPRCEEQGFILTYIRKKYPNVHVYSFDVNLDNVALDTIKEIYDVREAPTIVVNNVAYDSFLEKDDVERIVLSS
jgi:hypothetical protein